MNKIYIYGLGDPRNKEVRYIGKTARQDLNKRLKEHLMTYNLKKDTYKNHWIKSLLKENIKPSVFLIEITNDKKWQARERWWIAYCRKTGRNLTNGTEGGIVTKYVKEVREKMKRKTVTPETRKKMSEWQIGKKLSDKTKEKIRLKAIGRVLSKEHRDAIGKRHIGKIVPMETRIKLSIINKGRKISEQTQIGLQQYRIKKKIEIQKRIERGIIPITSRHIKG